MLGNSLISSLILIGKPITINDLEDLDPSLHKNLTWILENDVSELGMTFTYEIDFMGQTVTKELIPGGAEIMVDELNKKDYVKKFCEMKMIKEIESQLQAFIRGFSYILPSSFVGHLSPAELQMLISGLQEIDVKDMKANCKYRDGVSPSDPVAIWLWEILEEMTQTELATFLFFVSSNYFMMTISFE